MRAANTFGCTRSKDKLWYRNLSLCSVLLRWVSDVFVTFNSSCEHCCICTPLHGIYYTGQLARLPGNSGLFEVTQITCDLATISVLCTDKLPFDPWGSNVVYSGWLCKPSSECLHCSRDDRCTCVCTCTCPITVCIPGMPVRTHHVVPMYTCKVSLNCHHMVSHAVSSDSTPLH